MAYSRNLVVGASARKERGSNFTYSSSSFLLHSHSHLSSSSLEGERASLKESNMGNCQATDSAMVVIHHPGGRAERLYWPISVSKVMRSNPGHYVALVTFCQLEAGRNKNKGVHVKILRPTDTLFIGQVYRLVTSQEVMKDLWEKKYWRMKKNESDSEQQQQRISRSLECLKEEGRTSEWEKSIKRSKMERLTKLLFKAFQDTPVTIKPFSGGKTGAASTKDSTVHHEVEKTMASIITEYLRSRKLMS